MYLGIDLGTSGVKAILLSQSGQVVATHSEPLTLSRPHPLWSEQDPEQWLQTGKGEDGELSPADIETLIAERSDARANKNWARGDEIRDQLTAAGIVLEDAASGTSWRRG